LTVARVTIERNLPAKGFTREDSHHRYFYHEVQGKRTGAYAYTSHGSQYRTYGPELISRMKNTLKLDYNRQVIDLCNCPISGQDYNKSLAAKEDMSKASTQQVSRQKERLPRKKGKRRRRS
jgi:hypothetical protein